MDSFKTLAWAPRPSLVAVATGIVGSAWSSGAIAGMSFAAIPAFYTIPGSQNKAQAWAALFARGIAVMPKIAGVVGLAYGYVAYQSYCYTPQQGAIAGGSQWTGWAAAGVLALGIVPFTLAMMSPTNAALQEIADGVVSASDGAVTGLLTKWGNLNLVRSLLPLAATVTAMVNLSRGV